MRILHTSDWHLGRLFHGVHLTEDQDDVLSSLLRVIDDANDDPFAAVLVAGDIYDRSVPPAEAVELLDRVLQEIVLERGIPLLMISGNHDGAQRLAFGSRMLSDAGLHIAARPLDVDEPVILEDAHGPVAFVLVPWIDPEVARFEGAGDDVRTHADALAAWLARGSAAVDARATADGIAIDRRVAIAHAFVAGGSESDSERPVMVGGGGQVPASVFEGYTYSALGHLHRPQSFLDGRVRYSGSPLTYSFSEIGHQKSWSDVRIDGSGDVTVREVPITPRRAVRRIEGTIEALLADGASDPMCDDYLLVSLTNTQPVYDAMARLRAVYPNTLHIERSVLQTTASDGASVEELEALDPVELFAQFFEEFSGNAPRDDERAAFADAWDATEEADA